MNEKVPDEAELLRSLKPKQPVVDWQAVLVHVQDSKSERTAQSTDSAGLQPVGTVDLQPRSQSRLVKVASSWWSGALAGSLITLTLLQLSSPNRGIVDAKRGTEVKQADPPIDSGNIAELRTTESTNISIEAAVIEVEQSKLFRRHGLQDQMVSKIDRPSIAIPERSKSTIPIEQESMKSLRDLQREAMNFF